MLHHDFTRALVPGVAEIRMSGTCDGDSWDDPAMEPLRVALENAFAAHDPTRFVFDFTGVQFTDGTAFEFLLGLELPDEEPMPILLRTSAELAPRWEAIADRFVPDWREGSNLRVAPLREDVELYVLAAVPDVSNPGARGGWLHRNLVIARGGSPEQALSRVLESDTAADDVDVLDLAPRLPDAPLHHHVLRVTRVRRPPTSHAECLFGSFHADESGARRIAFDAFVRHTRGWELLGPATPVSSGPVDELDAAPPRVVVTEPSTGGWWQNDAIPTGTVVEGACRSCGASFDLELDLDARYPKGPGEWGPMMPPRCPRCGAR